jgi:hypothetical protein
VAGRPCFMEGARIRAARGDVPVEAITAGDEIVVIRDGSETIEQVKWVGHSRVDIARHRHAEDVAPIHIRKNAIADGQPATDLLLSPEHCLFLDGRCVPAKLLVNGGSIFSERDHAPFTYYHIELERHGILLAENTPAESYLDTGNRGEFDNADEPRQLHPKFAVNADSERWLTDACAPLAQVPDEVDPIWRRLAERSEMIGFPVPSVQMVQDADLHIVADGRAIQPVSDTDARFVFAVPAGVKSVSLLSRFCIPADKMIPSQRDSRRLGVSVSWIAIRTNGDETILAADHPALQEGWNDPETDGKTIWRWTDGAASIPWDKVDGSAVLTVRCYPVDQYPVYDEHTRLVA